MQPRNNNNNRMMPRNNKNRHGGGGGGGGRTHNNNQNRGGSGGSGGPNAGRGRINISHVTNQRDKFQNQARDAMHSGDRVLSEYYLQHADHYQRLINEFNEEQESRRVHTPPQQSDAGSNAENASPAPEPRNFAEEDSAPIPLPLPPAIPIDRDDLEPKDTD